MGWGRTLLLGDFGNRLDIGDCEKALAELRMRVFGKGRTDKAQDEALRQLERENGELKLYLSGLIRVLTAKGVLDYDDVASIVDVVDPEESATGGEPPPEAGEGSG